jgi:hypothetical protein
MERILVISYRFPPADETGTQRTWALAKYLKEFGYYPVFVTRNWSHPLKTLEDMNVPVGSHIEHEKNENYEVYILPHKNILKLRINKQFKSRFGLIRNVFNMLDYILMYLGYLGLNEFNQFKEQAAKIINGDPSIKKAIIITDPFPLFQIGYYLNKKYKTKWIADYRDDWNTREVNDTYNFKPTIFHKLAHYITSLSEKKWVSTSSYITSVSDEYTNRIARFVNVPGATIYNGYFEEIYNDFIQNTAMDLDKTSSEFTIVHNGTLYPTQEVDIFLNGLKRAVDYFKGSIKIQVKFIGVSYKKGAAERIEQTMKGYEENFQCTSRVSREELFTQINNAHLALMVSHGKHFKGITSSKIFDYVGLNKRVLCCPPDGDVVEKILKETGLGNFCETEDEVFHYLLKTITENMNYEQKKSERQSDAVNIYTRKNQTKKIAGLLDIL